MSFRKRLRHWIMGDLIGIDELGNAFALDGDAHETISSHCGSQIVAKTPCLFCRFTCWWLNFLQKDHCTRSWAEEKAVVDASKGLVGSHDGKIGDWTGE